MNVFISWSGPKSKAVARVVKNWLKSVIQVVEPWMSDEDINRGAQWFQKIGLQLNESTLGIFCLTQSNKSKPWILFEAGAIAKGSPENRVFTLLIDLQSGDIIDSPLSQFNHTSLRKEQMWLLVDSINRKLNSPLEEALLRSYFDRSWPEFEQKFQTAIEENVEVNEAAGPTEKEMLREALAAVRSLSAQTAAAQAVPTLAQRGHDSHTGAVISDTVLAMLKDLPEEDLGMISYMTLDQIQMMASWTRRLAEDRRDLDAKVGLDFLKRKVSATRDRITSGERNVPESPFQGPD